MATNNMAENDTENLVFEIKRKYIHYFTLDLGKGQ